MGLSFLGFYKCILYVKCNLLRVFTSKIDKLFWLTPFSFCRFPDRRRLLLSRLRERHGTTPWFPTVITPNLRTFRNGWVFPSEVLCYWVYFRLCCVTLLFWSCHLFESWDGNGWWGYNFWNFGYLHPTFTVQQKNLPPPF